ncbi:MAG: hypothetical protein AB1589_15505 [Cyanobacteriota bacterium]
MASPLLRFGVQQSKRISTYKEPLLDAPLSSALAQSAAEKSYCGYLKFIFIWLLNSVLTASDTKSAFIAPLSCRSVFLSPAAPLPPCSESLSRNEGVFLPDWVGVSDRTYPQSQPPIKMRSPLEL